MINGSNHTQFIIGQHSNEYFILCMFVFIGIICFVKYFPMQSGNLPLTNNT